MIASLLVFVVAAICVRLGFWQLDRLEQRRSANAVLIERSAAPPVTIAGRIPDTTGLRYRRAVAEGSWDGDRSIVLPGRAFRGTPGAYVLTPLRLGDGPAVLVNRGWVGAADGATVPDSILAIAGGERVEGMIDAFPGDPQSLAARADVTPDGEFRRVWYAIDDAALRDQFPYPLADIVLRRAPEGAPPGPPIPLEPPPLDEGPHLGYAIQWFAFAGIAIFGWVAMILRQERR